MNYIQRLFEAAAPPAPRTVAVPVAGMTTGSPIIAADQRLGMFPELSDPSAAPVGETNVTAPERAAAPVARARAIDRPVATAVERPPPNPSRPPESRAEAAAPAEGRATDGTSDPGPARYISPLERLAESAPLDPPVRRAPDFAGPLNPAAADSVRTETVTTRQPPQSAPVSARDAARPATPPEEPASVALEAMPLAAPFRVTADQFQPYASDAPPPLSAAAREPPQRTAPPLLEPRHDFPPTPPPLEPVARDAESPFARSTDAWPPPPMQERPPAPAITERVVERIREVSVAPPAPPPAMTAAAQSVIGALSQRGSPGWQPRQEGF